MRGNDWPGHVHDVSETCPTGARCAAATCGSLGVCFGATAGLLLLLLRRGVGSLFTQDEEVDSHNDTSHPASHAR